MQRRTFLKNSLAIGAMAMVTPSGLVYAFVDDKKTSDLAKAFANPPRNAGAYTWWHWMNGHVTKDGITRDLEAMAEVGMGGFQNFNVGSGIPKGPVEMLSPEWLDLTRHAISEAGRLGLEYQMHNCPGWSSTGGPWITPELSMQQVSWSESYVSGGKKISIDLPKPFSRKGFYKDTFVLAFPSLEQEAQSWHDSLARVSASSGAPTKEQLVNGSYDAPFILRPNGTDAGNVVFEFKTPREIRSMLVFASAETEPMGGSILSVAPVTLEASDDGSSYRKIHTLDVVVAETPGAGTFQPVKAKFFRVSFPAATRIYRIELQGGERLAQWPAKANYAGSLPGIPFKGFSEISTPVSKGWTIDPAKVLDISSAMDAAGKLNWNAPAGNWTIIRFGHTATARINKAAPTTGEGLECDKYSREAFDFHFDKMFEQLLPALKPLAGKGRVGVLIDSYEVGMQNWTKTFPEDFRKSRGYDIVKFLPAMTGRVVGSAERTDRFLWDLRRVQADLMADNYYGRCTERCHEHGMQTYTEPYNGGPLEQMQVGSRIDHNMGEFWVRTLHFRHSLKLASSIQHINGRKIVGAEAFTGNAMFSKWQEYPFAMKAGGDLMYTKGLNRFIFHRYAHQPHPTALPGMTMGPWGIHFDRTNTWFKDGKAWLRYVSRCQYVLQQGVFVADLLYYTSADAPGEDFSLRPNPDPAPPAGYDYDLIHTEALLDRVSIRNGKIMLPDGMSYRLLILPPRQFMPVAVAKKLRDLVRQGMTISGARPMFATGLKDSDVELKAIADELWGDLDGNSRTSRSFGSGKVYQGTSLETILQEMDVARDFSFIAENSDPAISYIHRDIDGADVYFIANSRRRKEKLECEFRVTGKQPEFWNPDTGERSPIRLYQRSNGITRIPLTLDEAGSAFIVFSGTADSTAITAVKRNGEVLHDADVARIKRSTNANVQNNFTLLASVKPECEIVFPGIDGAYGLRYKGISGLFPASQDGDSVYGPGHAIAGVTCGRNGVCVYESSSEGLNHVIVHPAPIAPWTSIAVVYRNGAPELYIDYKMVAQGKASGKTVHPGTGQEYLDQSMTLFEGDARNVEMVAQALPLADIIKRSPAPAGSNASATISINSDSDGRLHFWQDGSYSVVAANGSETPVTVRGLRAPQLLDGAWTISFPPNLGAPPQVTIPKLESLHRHSADGVKYFSGTATYTKQFNLTAAPGGNQRLYLDLGQVAVIATVTVNGKLIGTYWKRPFVIDISSAVKKGSNELRIAVTNLWPNRLIGDEQQPADNQYDTLAFNQKGGINSIPDWYVEGKPKPPSARVTFTTWKHFNKDSALLESGLVGPVVLRMAQVMV